jgi:phosphopantetheine adenylyltransferase
MVRGLRNNEDAEYEKDIMIYNKDKFGITKYFFIFADGEYENISSSMIRNLCETKQFHELHKYVSPIVIYKLLEHYGK